VFSAFINSFKIKELRQRILFAAGIVALCRIAAAIPCPGVNARALQVLFEKNAGAAGGFMGMFDMFSGGALENFAVATLGIMPYISASIIMTLLTPVIPALEKLAREGDVGRQKINQYMRYLTVLICIIQGAMAALVMLDPSRIGLQVAGAENLIIVPKAYFMVMTVIVLTAGTMLFVWLGEQITSHGIGNGVSLIITVNIVSRMPHAFYGLYDMARTGGGITGTRFTPVHFLILCLIFVGVTAATIMLTQGQRRIPIQMARRVVGFNKMKGGSTYMPLKVNFAGVMPIIFAGAILMFPSMILQWLPFAQPLARFFNHDSLSYMAIYGVLILVFSYFWVANQFNPIQIADNLKKEGAYIPGIRPGKPTADFLDATMTRITLAGAIFLAALAIFPMILYSWLRIPYEVASFFGGTSLLIIVGVMLDTLSQLESHLVMRNYDGFLKRGKIRGRNSGRR
jgi:preprotein translocase subunit SecY